VTSDEQNRRWSSRDTGAVY